MALITLPSQLAWAWDQHRSYRLYTLMDWCFKGLLRNLCGVLGVVLLMRVVDVHIISRIDLFLPEMKGRKAYKENISNQCGVVDNTLSNCFSIMAVWPNYDTISALQCLSKLNLEHSKVTFMTAIQDISSLLISVSCSYWYCPAHLW